MSTPKSVLKNYLERAFDINKVIRSKKEQIQKLRDTQTSISANLAQNKVQTSPDPDRLNKITDSILDLEKEYLNDIEKLTQAKRNIKRVIAVVDDLSYFLILEERYINLKEWKDIATDNDYSERQVYNLHGEALKELTDCILLQYLKNCS